MTALSESLIIIGFLKGKEVDPSQYGREVDISEHGVERGLWLYKRRHTKRLQQDDVPTLLVTHNPNGIIMHNDATNDRHLHHLSRERYGYKISDLLGYGEGLILETRRVLRMADGTMFHTGTDDPVYLGVGIQGHVALGLMKRVLTKAVLSSSYQHKEDKAKLTY